MQMTVDAVKVRQLKIRAVRQKYQNVRDEKIAGLAVIEALRYLGLWEGEENEGNKNPDSD